jgi:TonB family protein
MKALSLDFAPTQDRLSKSEADFRGRSGAGARSTSRAHASTTAPEMPQEMLGIGRSGQGGAKSRLGASFATKFVTGAVASALVFACGGSTPQPGTAPSPPPAETPTTPPSEKDASAAASEPAAAEPAAAASASAEPEPADPGPPGPKPIKIEMKDECTPVGVDFEKRARPRIKACYREGKKKNPNLEGTVRIKITVDMKGKIKSVKVIEKTLPDAVANCMLKAIKETPFPEVDKCWDSTLTIPVTFPTPP